MVGSATVLVGLTACSASAVGAAVRPMSGTPGGVMPHGGMTPDDQSVADRRLALEGPSPSDLRPSAFNRLGGGEDCDSATVIDTLPFVDSGTTRNKANDLQPSTCSLAGPAGDVVYVYTPAEDTCVNIDLCGSFYDTTLIVYADSCPFEFACNDDFCGFQSQINDLSLLGGVTYYFVVDGFDASEGDYTLVVEQCPPPCHLECPAGSLDEGEPDCAPGGIDIVNGGCNSDMPSFSPIRPGDTYCGTGKWDRDFPIRDTDWYKVVLPEDAVITWTVEPEFDALLGLVNNFGVDVCFSSQFLLFEFAPRCEVTDLAVCLPAGTWYLWVGADFGGPGFDCGGNYIVNLQAETVPGGCILPPCSDQCPGSGGCLEDNGTGGCDDEECCCNICLFDPFCCDVRWDEFCAFAAENACFDPPIGACCIDTAGECIEAVTANVCELTLQGRWEGRNSNCATIDPPCLPPSNGRCCFDDGTCQQLTQDPCTASGGDFGGPGTACLGDNDGDGNDDACAPIEVPTLGSGGIRIVIVAFIIAIVATHRRLASSGEWLNAEA